MNNFIASILRILLVVLILSAVFLFIGSIFYFIFIFIVFCIFMAILKFIINGKDLITCDDSSLNICKIGNTTTITSNRNTLYSSKSNKLEIKIIEGEIKSLKIDGNLECININGKVECDGNITCHDIIGNIECDGNIIASSVKSDRIQCDGNIIGKF
jgi:hypothetical protein